MQKVSVADKYSCLLLNAESTTGNVCIIHMFNSFTAKFKKTSFTFNIIQAFRKQRMENSKL